MVDMEKDITEASRTVTRTAEIVKDYEGLRAQFNNVLDLLLPGDGHDLLPLHGQDWPALKDEVIMWMEGQVYGRRLRQTIGSGAGRVDVEAEHLLDDYWWVTATPAGTDPNNAAMAVVRIRDSKDPCATGRATRPVSPDRIERGSRREPLTGPGGSPGPEAGRMPGHGVIPIRTQAGNPYRPCPTASTKTAGTSTPGRPRPGWPSSPRPPNAGPSPTTPWASCWTATP